MAGATKREWDEILRQDIYVYGAAKTAERIYNFLSERGGKVKGFLVTERKDNPAQLLDLPVEDIHVFKNKEACILVPHLGTYKEEIAALLESLGFGNVYLIAQLMARTMLEESEGCASSDYVCENEADDGHSGIRKQILEILQEGIPDFGGVVPYQSLEMIGLKAGRPTEKRIEEYGLRQILKAEDDVLDIGCNSGFFDILVAGLVHSVTGVEYDKTLVRVGELVRDYLKVPNCVFYNGDFKEWYKRTDRKLYNVIFSFAIHHWLDLSPQDYCVILDSLLKEEGYICFESHIYGMDEEADKCRQKLLEMGYQIICDKKVSDGGTEEREYILFKK